MFHSQFDIKSPSYNDSPNISSPEVEPDDYKVADDFVIPSSLITGAHQTKAILMKKTTTPYDIRLYPKQASLH